MMDLIHELLYRISNALLLPTLVAILGLTAWTALLAGGLLRELLARPKVRRCLAGARRMAKEGGAQIDAGAVMALFRQCSSGLPALLARQLEREFADREDHAKCLEDLECDVAGRLAKLSWLTRVAPMLGLMGTLIPLGPALTGLASGNLAVLSGNLVVAFTATVMGVMIGCVAFTLNLVKKNWYQGDLSDLEYIFSKLAPQRQPKPADAPQEAKVG